MGPLVQTFVRHALSGLISGGFVWYLLSPYERYGSRLHFLEHKFEMTAGRGAAIRIFITNPGYVNVYGLVCRKCGHVDVDEVLSDESAVLEKIHGRPTREFVWTDSRGLKRINDKQ